MPLFSFAQDVDVGSLRISASRTANPQVAFTNKRSSFFQTQTHANDHAEHAWFRGYSMAGRRILQDITVSLGGQSLDPSKSRATITPFELKRVYPNGAVELLRMYDNQDVIGLEYPNRTARPVINLSGEGLTQLASNLYSSGSGDDVLFVSVATGPGCAFVAISYSAVDAKALATRAIVLSDSWSIVRKQRMDKLISGDNFVRAGSQTDALRWMTLQLDALVTRQRGTGIYAGLPWFQEYWGRDQFIALPGATLVNGQFEAAKAILTSFARYQDRDENSPFYGRLPNIVKPNELNYHTTDGTPRFVIALKEYVDYSGDLSLMRELYPVVHASIEGSLKNFTDESGFLTHADNETWMDARCEPDKVSYSPRANRANDIQSLWIQQLEAGVAFAEIQGDIDAHLKWEAAAEKARRSFTQQFVHDNKIADHLNADGSRDMQVRPNAFFAMNLVDNDTFEAELKRLWSQLVYPWGVATLSASDPQFLKYHLAPGQWHKDAAYHNGTVWPWLDGIAMQRVIEADRPDIAWRLFKFNNAMALRTNGSLPETMDAHPHPGEKTPRLTGTYSQAWSLAEQLRTWYQGFAGIRPQLSKGVVVLAPRLVDRNNIKLSSRVGNGTIRFTATPDVYQYSFEGITTRIVLDLPNFERQVIAVKAGDQLHVRGGKVTHLRNGQTLATIELKPSKTWRMDDVAFAQP